MLWIVAIAVLMALAVTADAGAVPLWGRWERRFGAGGSASPDTELEVRLTSPTGKERVVPGYWDGGSDWAVRFMPNEEGTWRYSTRSQPGDKGLDGQEGAFECRRMDDENRFLRHGPVIISGDGRHFEHFDGTPFFWLADTVWSGPQLASKADWDRFLKNRREKRFTGIQFVLTAPWRSGTADENGEASFTGRDPMQINPKYFQRMDERMEAINAQGLVAIPVMLWAIGEKDIGRILPEEELIQMANYLLARYSAHHVLWILAGDDRYEGENAEKWRRIGRAVFEEKDHSPVTLHPQGMQWPFEQYRDEEWLSYYGYQSGHGDDADTLRWLHSGPPAQYGMKTPHHPIVNLEPPYEDHVAYQSRERHTPYTVRRAVYWSLFNAPTAGVTYGGHGVWSWHTKEGEAPTDHPNTGEAKRWDEAMDFPGSTDMKHLKELMRSITWWKLDPAPSLLVEQPGKDDPAKFVSAARSEDRDLAVLYLPVGGEVELEAGALNRGVRTEWFDPRNGQWLPAQMTSMNRFRAPDESDWVLVIRATL